MNNFLVEISYEAPYPKTMSKTVAGTSMATAIGRAVREWKKEQGRKRITRVKIVASKL